VLDDAVAAVLAAYPTIHTALRRRLEQQRSRGTRLSPQLAQLLEQLDPVRPLAVGELAARMRVTPATISLQLTRLARLRLVTRTRDESDGRRVQLRLTEAGVRLRGQRSLLDPERVRGALARLSTADQDVVAAGVRLLARVARSVSSPDMSSTPSSQRNRES
jgi:DNA-binding MarR family transcriptional regulator